METLSQTSEVNNNTVAFIPVNDDRVLKGDVVTVIRDPDHILGKQFTRNSKKSAVSVSVGYAVQVHVPTPAAMAKVLQEVSENPHMAIIPSGFPDVGIGEEFLILSQSMLKKILKRPDMRRADLLGVHRIKYKGKEMKALCRLKENTVSSRWVLIDRDVDDQTPEEFGTGMGFNSWRAAMEKLLPGFAQAPQIHVASASARVMMDGQPVGAGNGHVYVQVDDASDVERLRTVVLVEAAKHDMTWLKVNKRGAKSLTTIIDLSVLIRGRLVFCGKPTASDELVVVDQVVTVAGGEIPLDTSVVELPPEAEVREITRAAGAEMSIRQGRDGRLPSTPTT